MIWQQPPFSYVSVSFASWTPGMEEKGEEEAGWDTFHSQFRYSHRARAHCARTAKGRAQRTSPSCPSACLRRFPRPAHICCVPNFCSAFNSCDPGQGPRLGVGVAGVLPLTRAGTSSAAWCAFNEQMISIFRANPWSSFAFRSPHKSRRAAS